MKPNFYKLNFLRNFHNFIGIWTFSAIIFWKIQKISQQKFIQHIHLEASYVRA